MVSGMANTVSIPPADSSGFLPATTPGVGSTDESKGVPGKNQVESLSQAQWLPLHRQCLPPPNPFGSSGFLTPLLPAPRLQQRVFALFSYHSLADNFLFAASSVHSNIELAISFVSKCDLTSFYSYKIFAEYSSCCILISPGIFQ